MLNKIHILVRSVSIPIIWELQIVIAMCYLTCLICILWAYARLPFCAKEHISSLSIYIFIWHVGPLFSAALLITSW